MNAYQLLKSIGDIDDTFILEINEYNKAKQKRKTGIFAGLSLAVCAIICAIGYQAFNQTLSKPKEIQTDAVKESTAAKENIIDINEGSKYFHTKFGGRLAKVTPEEWLAHYSTSIFDSSLITGYSLSRSNENKILYGVLNLKLQDGSLIDISTGPGPMIDSGYEELTKTNINGADIAVCSLLCEEEETVYEGIKYYAIYQSSDTVYTIESGEQDIDRFLSLLNQIVKP